MTDPRWAFPEVEGRDLTGRAYRLPADFPAVVTVAVLAFKQQQQSQVDAWIARLAQEGVPDSPFGRTDLDKVVLELPVLPGRYQVVRRFIDGGMATSIRVPEVLARTITIYGSVDGLCRPLGIGSRDSVSVRVVRRDGTVVWGYTGTVSDDAVSDVMTALRSGGAT